MAWWSDLGTVVGGPQTGEEEVPWWSGLGSLVAEPESGGQGIAGPQVPPLESTYTPAELPADTTYGGRHVLTAPPFESPQPSAGSIMGVPLESFNRWQAEMESLPPGSPERDAMARILAPMRQAMAQHIRDTQEAERRGLSPIQHAASQDPVQAGIESLPVVARGAAMGMLGVGKTIGNIAGEVRGTDPDGQTARDRSDKVNRVWEFQQGLNRAYDRESYLAENIGPRWSENVGMVSEFIPQSLLAGKAGGIKSIAALYGATSFDESLTEAKDSGLSDTKAALYASGTAALEAGIMLAFGAAGKSLGVQTAEEVLSSKSLAQSLLTRSGLKQALLGAAGEAVEEGLTQATQQVWSDIMGAGSVEGIGENVLRALELGGLGGGVAHGVARAAQALESSVNLIKKAEADEPVSRGDLEKAGIPSRGTSAKSRKQVAKEFAEEQRDRAAAAWSDPPPGTRVRIEQGEGAARRREQVAQRLEMEESERLAQIPMPGEQPQETLQAIPTQAETPADTPPAADTPADTPESSGDSVHFLSDPNIDWTESDQKTLGRHFRNFRRRKDFDSGIIRELESLEPRTALDVIAEAEYRADADNERLAAIRLEYNTLFPDKRGVTNRARLAEMRGGDPNQIPGFDEMVQALRDGEYPHLAAEASSLGHGNLEAGLFSILQGGIKQFEKIQVDQYLPDVLDELRRFQESEPAPAPVREGPSEWSDPALLAARPEQPAQAEQPEQPSSTETASEPPSGEGAADESFSLARQPATRPRDPASEVESIPTHQPDLIPDLWRDSLEGQQGLFDEAASGEQDLGGAHYAQRSPLLQPEMAAPRTVTPKSLRAIITDLSKAMNVPVRFGRLRSAGRKMGGYFLPQENLIAIRRANDLPVASHEFGHKIDAMFKLSANKNIARELERLGDPETPGSMSSWTKSKTKSYQRGEGVAEFVRYWLVEPTTAQRQSPHTFSEFESILDANPDLATLLRQAQEDIHLWRTADPQARLRSHISRGDDPTKPRYELKHLVRDLVDNLHIFRLVVDDAKLARPNLPASENPYILARNLRGSYGMASTFVRRGVADFRTKEVTLGTSLEDALRPVSGRIRDFGDWIVAKRAQELHARGAETGLVPSDVDATAAKFDHDPQFHEAFDRIKQWNDALLQYAIDAGLVTEESGQAMRELSANYVPFHRIFEVGAGESPSSFAQSGGSGAGLNLGRPASLRRMKEEGSTRQIIDPLETMVKNAYTIITAAEKAAINHAIARLASVPGMGKWVERIRSPMQRMEFDIQEIRKQLEEELGIDPETIPDDLLLAVYRPASRVPQGENIIRIPRDGKFEYYRLNRDLYDTFHALDQESSGMLIRYLSAPAQTLRAGVALEPGFNVFNAVRDTFGAAVLSKVGALPFETTARGVAAMVGNPQLVAEWSAAGGQSAVEATFFDRKKMQQYLAEKIAKDLTPAERALVVAKSPLTALRWATGVFEESTRIGEYQLYYDHLRRSGMAAGDARRMAAFEARDRQDFGKGGAKTKVLRRLAPFWNAALQGNVKVIENHRDHPLRTALQGTAFVTIPTMALLAINWDDQDYWDRPWWERDAFWLFPIGKDDAGHTRFLRLPKPFLLGLMYGVLPERILGWAKTNNPAALGDFPGVLFQELVTSAMPIPQAVSVIVENSVGDQGWSFFRNRPIVPDSLADYPPEMQWTEHTTELAKRVGKSLGMSPLKVDHFIEQTTGGMGQILSGRKSLVSRFFTRDLALSSQPLQDFYEIRDQLVKETTAARVNQTGQRPVAMTMFEQAARRISDLRKQAYNLPQGVERARIENEAFTIARQTVEAYRSDPAPRQAVAERRETLNKGLRRTIRRGKGESPMDWRKRQESHAEYRRRIQQELAELEKLP